MNTERHSAGTPGSVAWPYIATARLAMATVLVHAADDRHTMLIVGEAMSVLNEVVPPYPPIDYPDEGIDAETGIRQALNALAQAAAAAVTMEEAARIARSAEILTRHPSAPG